jgi:hypothetical protein
LASFRPCDPLVPVAIDLNPVSIGSCGSSELDHQVLHLVDQHVHELRVAVVRRLFDELPRVFKR